MTIGATVEPCRPPADTSPPMRLRSAEYHTFLHHYDDSPPHRAARETWFQEGLVLLKANLHDAPACDTLLYQLLSLFPQRPELYYFQGCMAVQRADTPAALCWFQMAFHEFYRGKSPEAWSPYHIENLLDYFKYLFENNYTHYMQHLLTSHVELFRQLSTPPCDIRWLLLLGAFYIKTNQLKPADGIYSYLLANLDTVEKTMSKDITYKIYNNCLILYTRMACFERIPALLRRNFDICHSMLEDATIEWSTKKNVFCSNMLQFDYNYYLPSDHRSLCKYVESYFPVQPYVPRAPAPARPPPETVDLLDLDWPSPLPVAVAPKGLLPPPRIRIGYLSSDFVEHVVSHFILPILQHHDTSRFDVTLFPTQNYTTLSCDPRYANNGQLHRIVDIQHLSTKDAVDRIREVGVDILVDLNGFTEGNRLDVLACNPAPIQVAYLGFPNTVGSDRICRYRLTDGLADLPDSQQWFAETRLLMNRRGFLLYQPLAQCRPVAFQDGQSPQFPWVILGAINRESKNSPEAMQCWRAILLRAPHTKILIKLSTVEDDQLHRAKYVQALEGISPDRILFSTYGTIEAYYQLFSLLDMVLDTFPYSGTTTTCNALYNSVPVVTVIHRDLHVHNVSASIVVRSGFPELVARSPAEYIEKTVQLAMDEPRRRRYRGNLHETGAIHHGFVAAMQPEPFMQEYESIMASLVQAPPPS